MPHSKTAAALVTALACLQAHAADLRPFPRDPAQEAQIAAIVAHMTLAQKVGQITQPDIRAITPDEVRQYYIGSVLNGGGAWPNNDKHATRSGLAALADALWDASMTPTWPSRCRSSGAPTPSTATTTSSA